MVRGEGIGRGWLVFWDGEEWGRFGGGEEGGEVHVAAGVGVVAKRHPTVN
jgi:hypothetical protein